MKIPNLIMRLFKLIPLFIISFNYSFASQANEELIAKCDSCHGKNGVSQASDIPTIAGIPEWNLSDQMLQYLDGRPAKTVNYVSGNTSETGNMQSIVEGLTEEQVEQLAAYYSAFEFVKASQPFDENMAKQGEDIHEKQCDSCHSKGGSDPEDEASILAGQHKEYILSSLREYKEAKRPGDKKMLREIQKLNEDQLVSLAEYYASVQ